MSNSALNRVILTFYLLIPVCIVTSGFYFFTQRNLQNKIYSTKEDLKFITNNIRENNNGKYKDITNEIIALSNFLPFDINAKESPVGTLIPNRFGGKMYFYEAFANVQERNLFLGLQKEPQKYKDIYNGVGSYIVFLTGLTKKECISLSQVDWRKDIPYYLGFEAAAQTYKSKLIGFYNLQAYLLLDNLGERYTTKDYGTISRKPISYSAAKNACNCFWRNCSFALKFL